MLLVADRIEWYMEIMSIKRHRVRGQMENSPSKRYPQPAFKDNADGSVEYNGMVLPADMSDKLKSLNVYIDSAISNVIISFSSLDKLLMTINCTSYI